MGSGHLYRNETTEENDESCGRILKKRMYEIVGLEYLTEERWIPSLFEETIEKVVLYRYEKAFDKVAHRRLQYIKRKKRESRYTKRI